MASRSRVLRASTAGVSPTLNSSGLVQPFLPVVAAPVNGVLEVGLKPGLVTWCPWTGNNSGASPWVTINNFHIKIDGCVGQSFIRSYAVLTRVTDQSDVVLSYIGVTKTV